MQKKTILYMGNFELPDKNAAAHRVMNNAKIFRKLGYRVAFLGTVRDEHFSSIRRSQYDDNIFEEAYPLGIKQWVKHIFDTTNIQSLEKNYDDVCLVIVYNTPFATFKAVKKAFSKKGIKVAYDCTEWNSFAEGSLPKRLYKKFDETQIRNRLHKNCDDIIVISKLMESKYKGANLLRLPPLVDLDDPIWHQEATKNKDVFEFCFAGTTGNKEKIDVLISSFSKLDTKNCRLRIIGTEKNDYLQVFPQHKELLDNDDRIVFMGRLSHSDTVKYVLSCDCYVFIRESTRRNEAGFPTKFAESFTCGAPIISTDVSDIKDFADDRICLLSGVCEQTIVKALKNASNNFEKNNCLRDSFDYRQYLEDTAVWLSEVFK